MIKFFKQPHHLYGMVVLFYLVLALLSDSIIQIANHDTYIILSTAQFFLLVWILAGLYFVVAYFFKRTFSPLNRFLTYFHLILNLVVHVAISLLHAFKTQLEPTIYKDFSSYQQGGGKEIKTAYSYNEWLSLSLLCLILFQSIFVLNVIYTLIRKNNSSDLN